MTLRWLAAALAVSALPFLSAAPAAQSDLDAFMSRVLERRDENWKKLQQYILDEDERVRVVGPDGTPLYGHFHQYSWFIRDGLFVRSPIRANGVAIAEPERVKYERDWLARERQREKREAEKAAAKGPAARAEAPAGVQDVLTAAEPRFISHAYFLKFKFDPGQYALAGRETLHGRPVLRIEYYPTRLFTDSGAKEESHTRDREDEFDEKMNKVSLVTLWIDPEAHQILRYEFENIGMDFLPGRSLARVDELTASMRMTEAFPDVWLPAQVDMRFRVLLAIGAVSAQYDVRYHNYREAAVKVKIK